jgi:hypothetical protein
MTPKIRFTFLQKIVYNLSFLCSACGGGGGVHFPALC